MRDLGRIIVPGRFGVYAVLGAAAAWITKSDAVLGVYAAGLASAVLWFYVKGDAHGQSPR